MGNTAEQIDRALPRIAEMKLFQGDNYVDDIFYGESVYGPLHDPMFIKKSDPKPEQLALWRKIATEIAKDRPAAARPRQPDRHDRRLPRSDRGDQQAIPDQEPALGAGARQSAQRDPARAHARTGHVRRRASVGASSTAASISACSATRRTTWRRSTRFKRAASSGASAATEAARIRSCRSRRCIGRSPARWSAERRRCVSRSAAKTRSSRTRDETRSSCSRRTISDRFRRDGWPISSCSIATT